MSILNHSIPANGLSSFPSKGAGAQDLCQHLPIAVPLHGIHSMRSAQPNSLKKPSLTIASGDSPQGESYCRVPDVGAKNKRFQNGTPEESINGISNLSHLLGSNEEHSHSLDHPVLRVVHDEICTTVRDRMEFDPLTQHFLNSHSVNPMGELAHLSSEPNVVLSVVVSSAVKLNGRQIDLIARKMQRLTGFRNLRLENNIDPSLIAGFIISYNNDGSQVIDLSVRGQLAALAARVEFSDQRIANYGHSWSFPSSRSSKS